MKEEEEIKLIKSIKTAVISNTIKWVVGTAGACVLALIVFYFNTTYVLAQTVKDTSSNTKNIIHIKDVVNDLKVLPKINTEKIENIEIDVDELKLDVKEIRKSNQKIMELLFQIKQNQKK